MMAAGPLQSTVSKWIQSIFQGTPFGSVYRPPAVPPTPTTVDGRTAALRILRRYISELTFYRSGDLVTPATATSDDIYGAPIPFQIPLDQIFIEAADNDDQLHMPSIAILPGEGTYDVIGLTSFLVEDTRDVFGSGTVLQWQSEYVEDIQLEITAGQKAERRAIIKGLEEALVPTEQLAGIRFKMPAYYGQLVCFELGSRRIIEDESGRNRRKATMTLNMRYTVVALVNYVPLTPQITVETSDDPEFEVDEALDPRA